MKTNALEMVIVRWTLPLLISLLFVPLLNALNFYETDYLTYTALRYNPYVNYRLSHGDKPEWVTTSLMFYNYSGVLYRINAYNDTEITFKLKDKGEYIISHVTVLLSNVTVMTFLPKGVSPPIFWNESELISKKTEKSHDTSFKDWMWYVFKLRRVKISGEYLIRKSDLTVIKDKLSYGHTMLFDDPGNPLKEGETFTMYPFSTTIDKITINNEDPLKWRNITYYPPIKTVVTNHYSFNLTQPFGKGFPVEIVQLATLIYTFDASDGKLIATPNGGPDLWAIGILDAQFMDEYAEYRVEVEHDNSYATGLVLKSFRINERTTEEVIFNKPKTEVAYLFYGSLILVGLVIVSKSRRGTSHDKD
ncbi:hypothetical protein [Thermococcus sp.]|uniref:hypothetical protein n=1 Tax=Thermococcus sp. TaxID=35749 RepID=UPI0025EE7666|nr:hypothetical protein [Thermococcus sp.]